MPPEPSASPAASGPSAGPSVWTELTHAPLAVAAAHEFLADERAGGTCVFVGTSRRWTDGLETRALDYHAYEPMAETSLAELAAQAAERWRAVRVVVLHRLGVVPPPQASVVVGVACAHRAPAFEAARWIIDTLKDSTPIWKRDL